MLSVEFFRPSCIPPALLPLLGGVREVIVKYKDFCAGFVRLCLPCAGKLGLKTMGFHPIILQYVPEHLW